MDQLETTELLPKGVVNVKLTQKKEEVKEELPKMPTLAEIEKEYINQVLNQVGGSKEKAATVLGVSVKTVYNKLNSYKK